ncbi:MAG TPA: hypothetical protein VGH04_08625 [Gemmatimonadaceae bacterium]
MRLAGARTRTAVRAVSAAGFVAAVPIAAGAQLSLPRPPGGRVVNVSASELRGNEPGIAVNPHNPAQVVADFRKR